MSILSCGYNGFQNLGTTHENHIVNGDVELLPPTVLQIAAGYSKTYALLESGEVVELSSKLQGVPPHSSTVFSSRHCAVVILVALAFALRSLDLT